MMTKPPKIKAALLPDNIEKDTTETVAVATAGENAAPSNASRPSLDDGNATPSPPDGGGNPPAADEKDVVLYRVLSPLKYDGKVLSAGDEVALSLGADEIAALTIEGLIEALEP